MLITLWPPLWCLGGRDSDSNYENPYVLGTIAPYHHQPSSTNSSFEHCSHEENGMKGIHWPRLNHMARKSYTCPQFMQCSAPNLLVIASVLDLQFQFIMCCMYIYIYISGMSSTIHYCTPSACWSHVSRGHVWGLQFLHYAHAACSPVAYSDFRWHLSVLVAKHDFIMTHREKATNWANSCSMRQCAKERHIFSARLKTLLFQAVVTYRIASIGYVPPDSRTKHDIL